MSPLLQQELMKSQQFRSQNETLIAQIKASEIQMNPTQRECNRRTIENCFPLSLRFMTRCQARGQRTLLASPRTVRTVRLGSVRRFLKSSLILSSMSGGTQSSTVAMSSNPVMMTYDSYPRICASSLASRTDVRRQLLNERAILRT